MLQVKNLYVNVGDKEVLHDINLQIDDGETHVLLGPNGSGKTTLLMTLMGYSNYTVTKGTITYNGEDVTNMHANERAKRGIGMLFQRPPTHHLRIETGKDAYRHFPDQEGKYSGDGKIRSHGHIS